MTVFTDQFEKMLWLKLHNKAEFMLARIPAMMPTEEFFAALLTKSDCAALVRASELVGPSRSNGEFQLAHDSGVYSVLYVFNGMRMLTPNDNYHPKHPEIFNALLDTQITLAQAWIMSSFLFVKFNRICNTGAQLALHLPWVKQVFADCSDLPTPTYYTNDQSQAGCSKAGSEKQRDGNTHRYNLRQVKSVLTGKSDDFIPMTREQRDLCRQSGQVFAQAALLAEVTPPARNPAFAYLTLTSLGSLFHGSNAKQAFNNDDRFKN